MRSFSSVLLLWLPLCTSWRTPRAVSPISAVKYDNNFPQRGSNKLTVSAICLVSTLLNVFVPTVPAYAAEGQLQLEQKVTARQQVIRETESFLFNNKLLEAIRKMDQFDRDEDVLQTNKAILLVPIVDILGDIERISALISTGKEEKLAEAFTSLSSPKFETKLFKKTFNRYSDNIFISDPKRTNIYLAGGAMPTSLQTQQYLLRNQALTQLDNVRDDVRLMLEDVRNGQGPTAQDIADAVDDCREALDAMQSYLQLADPEDVKLATKVIQSSR